MPAKRPKAKQSDMRRFVLVRSEDVSGTSGTGVVAEGVQFSNGRVSIHWISQYEAVEDVANIAVVEQIHGHEGKTTIEWIDK